MKPYRQPRGPAPRLSRAHRGSMLSSMTLRNWACSEDTKTFRPPTASTRSVLLGGLILTGKIRGPSQVVATRMSVDLERMYSCISAVMVMESGLVDIKRPKRPDNRNRLYMRCR